jgi:hypothetical protein
MVVAVPEFQSDLWRTAGIQNTAYVHVVKAYAAALHDAGKTTESAQWTAKITKNTK